MRRNFGVFAASDWLPVISRSSKNAFSINQLSPPSLYRSLGVRIEVGIGLPIFWWWKAGCSS
jgi:hypothetical protein